MGGSYGWGCAHVVPRGEWGNAFPPGPRPPVVPAPTVTAVAPPEFAFVILADDTGTITLEAPSTWVDVNTGAWTSDGVDIGPSLRAAVDLPAWIEGGGT